MNNELTKEIVIDALISSLKKSYNIDVSGSVDAELELSLEGKTFLKIDVQMWKSVFGGNDTMSQEMGKSFFENLLQCIANDERTPFDIARFCQTAIDTGDMTVIAQTFQALAPMAVQVLH